MEPGDIFWARVKLVKRAGYELHPVVFYKQLTDSIIVFGGTSTPDDDFELLHTVNFGETRYRRLHVNGLKSRTLFYWELFQTVPIESYRVLYTLDDVDFGALLKNACLLD